MGTPTGKDRWWSNPARRRCSSGPAQGLHRHTASAPGQSVFAPRPRRYASLASRWHRPESSAGPAHESRCDRVSPPAPTGRSQCRAAFTVGQLGEGHRPVLLRAGQRSHTVIATIPLNQPGKGRPGNELHQLREQGLAGIHCGLQAETPQPRHARNSSRHHPFSPGNPQNSWRSWSRLLI